MLCRSLDAALSLACWQVPCNCVDVHTGHLHFALGFDKVGVGKYMGMMVSYFFGSKIVTVSGQSVTVRDKEAFTSLLITAWLVDPLATYAGQIKHQKGNIRKTSNES